jgi:uncharacterized membrane protein YqiK
VRADAQAAADALKLRAQAEADAAELQALSITKLAAANREKGLNEAEVLREKTNAENGKSRDILVQQAALQLIAQAPAIVRELVKPAERIGEIKVLQLAGAGLGGLGGGGAGAATGAGAGMPLLGSALGPVTKTILETSAMLPLMKEFMKFADPDGAVRDKVVQMGSGVGASLLKPAAAPAAPSNGSGKERA